MSLRVGFDMVGVYLGEEVNYKIEPFVLREQEKELVDGIDSGSEAPFD